jgi:hypothetical protein
MSGLNFRISAKLGITADISVLLVGGMLANQVIGNQAATKSSELVVLNGLNKSNARSAETAMLRGQLALRDIGLAQSPETLDTGLRTFRENTTDARAQANAAGQSATRQVMRDLYRRTGCISSCSTAASSLASWLDKLRDRAPANTLIHNYVIAALNTLRVEPGCSSTPA